MCIESVYMSMMHSVRASYRGEAFPIDPPCYFEEIMEMKCPDCLCEMDWLPFKRIFECAKCECYHELELPEPDFDLDEEKYHYEYV